MPSRTETPTNQARQRLAVAQRVAGLYVIIDPAAINGRDPSNVAEGALRGGATSIQFRDKIHDKGDQLAIARSLKALCENHNAIFIVNDHADLAVASVSHSLHLGQHDPRRVRERTGQGTAPPPALRRRPGNVPRASGAL